MHTAAFGAKFPESNFPSKAPTPLVTVPLVTVWGTESLLVHLMILFTAMETLLGTKVKFDIATDVTVVVGHVTIFATADETVVALVFGVLLPHE